MARARFVWDRSGYSELMDGHEVQALVQEKAEEIAEKATSMLDKDEGYLLEDFEIKEFQGRMARGRVVFTKTDHARYSQNKNKTLTKAMNAARG